ncbi:MULTISPECIES: FAD-binding domain-containing protein [unclassified Methylophilus]|uniref:FAD-binding domain-containing protein n=1 Tax=unclassified Methylophilus TaxID=2630143 RepID=UPI00037C7970|nr:MULTISPECIES: FAD-binding domain-containing protein [unclassified Methylophilus]
MTQPPTRLTLASDRYERLAQISECFPQATGPDLSQAWQGGRAAALQKLSAVDAEGYARSRNQLTGAVTGLSPYLRHGCLSLPETVADIHTRFGKRAHKLTAELSYRDYFRQVWYRFGAAIMQPMESPKVALGEKPMPDFIPQGFTGLVCMDEIVRQLQQHGYVHNHARMWFAAYVVHWLKIDWRQAADWFESQLLDGDTASNHLSWQWIASSFSNKPYLFNKENLIKFGGEPWCKQCRVACPFEGSYEQLHQQLFTDAVAADKPVTHHLNPPEPEPKGVASLVWIHDEMLSPSHALHAFHLPAVFVFDASLYQHWPLKRLQFMADCLAEMPGAEVWLGETRQVLAQRAQGRILTQDTPQQALKQAAGELNIEWRAEPGLTDTSLSDHQLMRFSRYWKAVEPTLTA